MTKPTIDRFEEHCPAGLGTQNPRLPAAIETARRKMWRPETQDGHLLALLVDEIDRLNHRVDWVERVVCEMTPPNTHIKECAWCGEEPGNPHVDALHKRLCDARDIAEDYDRRMNRKTIEEAIYG
jgi:hypothetical protein